MDTRPTDTVDTTIEPERRRFTLEEYHRMGEVGIFREGERLELIEGEIVEMSPIGRVHAGTVDRIATAFWKRLGDRAGVRVQGPVAFTDLVSEVQPDVTLLVPRPDFYASGHPGAANVILAVEVMDTTVPYDRGVKLRLYARAGVAEVWLVNVNTRRIEGHRGPGPQGYGESRVFQIEESITIQAFPDVPFTVRDLLG
jgi:Uma2 family endonuclease